MSATLSVLKFLFICLEVLIFFNLMIIVHELGHFLAARWRGLVIEKFGIWFGKPIWKKKINGVEYSLGSIPAGGFVALPQLAPMEVMEGKVETPREQLPPISALDKIIVAFAGPLFSFLLAVVFAVAVWVVGRPVSEGEATTVIGYVEPGSPSAEAGLKPGDKITKVDGVPVTRFGGMGSDSITWRIIRSEGGTLPIEVERNEGGQTKTLTLEAKPVVPNTTIWKRKGLRQIKIGPAQTPVVGEVTPGTPAAEAGLQPGDQIIGANGASAYDLRSLSEALSANPGQPLRFTIRRGEQTFETPPLQVRAAIVADVTKGLPADKAGVKPEDRILAIDGQPIASAEKLVEAIIAHGARPMTLAIERQGQPLEIQVAAAMHEHEGKTRPMIGIRPEDDFGIKFNPRGIWKTVHPGPIEQIRKAAVSIFDTVGAIISKKSDVKLQHMGGPVMMMRVYYSFFEMDFADGWRLAFWFSVVLNVNLAMLNMLPIPVLDGGHITLALVEAARRKPVNVRFLEYVQTGCAVLIIGFMVYIFYFDVHDWVADGGSNPRPKPVPVEVAK